LNWIHVITPIVSQGFRGASLPTPIGCKVTNAQISLGPASIESAVDEVLAAPGVVDAAIRAESEGVQAVIIDCMLDPGLDAAREAVSIPVIGCGEAAMLQAAGSQFGIVTVLQRQERAFRDLARKYELANYMTGTTGIGIPVLALETDRTHAIEATIAGSRQAISKGAEVIIFGCTGMLGFADEVSAALNGVNVIDPLPNAINSASAAIQNGQKTDKSAYPTPESKSVAGFEQWSELNALMKSSGNGCS
jgi:allantoin racemase